MPFSKGTVMPRLRLPVLRGLLMVAFAATIAACATSPVTKPLPRDADPIVETRTVERRVCPAELLTPVPAKPARTAGGFLEGDAASLDWVGRLARWGEALAARLTDAAKAC